MKKWITIILIILPMGLKAADLSILQILQFSNYNDISTLSIPESEIVENDFQPVYFLGYYFLDTRFQNIGNDNWLFRGLFKMKALFTNDRYEPDFRYAYVENKKPIGGHWFVSAGRLSTFNFIPIQRLDGANIAFTPDADKGWVFGLIGGMVPEETSGYRDLYLYNAPYRAGAYVDYKNKNSDQFKVQYNAGFDADTDTFHQLMGQFAKKYKVFKLDSVIRGGILYTIPYDTFDYVFAENSLYTSPKFIHALGYLKSETIFLFEDSFLREDFQQAFYRMSYTSNNDAWRLNARGGYTYSMEDHGYIAQLQVMRRKFFEKENGQFGLDILAQRKGIYDQYLARTNFGIFPLGYINLGLYMGFEYFKYRSTENNALVYGLTAGGEFLGGFSWDLTLDLRSIIDENTELYAGFNLVHVFRTPLGKKTKDENTPSSLKPDWKTNIQNESRESVDKNVEKIIEDKNKS
jgi:hypothetical protein